MKSAFNPYAWLQGAVRMNETGNFAATHKALAFLTVARTAIESSLTLVYKRSLPKILT